MEIIIPTAVLAFAILLVFVFPIREVTQPPGKLQVVWETLAPGTSPAWGFFGGIVLVAWTCLLLQDLFLFWKGSPYIITMIAVPNLESFSGIPVKTSLDVVFRLINPSWVWVYLAPAALFAVNLLLVFRDRLFRKSV